MFGESLFSCRLWMFTLIALQSQEKLPEWSTELAREKEEGHSYQHSVKKANTTRERTIKLIANEIVEAFVQVIHGVPLSNPTLGEDDTVLPAIYR